MSNNGLSTKDIQVGGASIPKLLQPGNRVIKIDRVYLEPFSFIQGAYQLILDCTGPDMGPDFEGFYIDQSNPSAGRHRCQIGRIKASEWAFADGKTKSGVPINRDIEVMKFLKNLCVALNSNWMDEADGKYNTIEEMVAAFNEQAPFEGKFINTCLAGREYMNKQGYSNYDLYFPRFSKGGKPFEPEGVAVSKVAKFDENTHIKRAPLKEVSEFGNTSSGSGDGDFEL